MEKKDPTLPLYEPIIHSSAADSVNAVLRRVYLLMSLGLLVTAGSAWLTFNSSLGQIIASNQLLFYIALFAPIAFVLLFAAAVWKMKPAIALTLFLTYALVNGVSLSFIVFRYTEASIAIAFFSTAAVFGTMSFVGLTTRTDLTRYGSFFLMGLVGLLVGGLLNFFFRSSAMSWLLTYAGLALFLGLTAYDVQVIRRNTLLALQSADNPSRTINTVAISGAFSLYLNFINIFLRLLRILGKEK